MTWQDRVAEALGTEVVSAPPVQGGDLSEVFRAELSDGRRVAVKRGARVGTEARMLRAMAEAGAPVPRVLWASGDLICLEWLNETRASAVGWRALGQGLRHLHGETGKSYGWDEDYAFGRVGIENARLDDWGRFWAERRLLPFVSKIGTDLGRRIETLAAQVSDHLPKTPAPALLHGDLWVGNALFSDTDAFMIDPACYHGHAEVDLAMLTLFGQPERAFWEGYGAPEPGWEARRPLYQLWPALVHLRLFGAGYRGMVTDLLDQTGV